MDRKIEIFSEEKKDTDKPIFIRLAIDDYNAICLVECDENGRTIDSGYIVGIHEKGLTLQRGYEGSLPTKNGKVKILE